MKNLKNILFLATIMVVSAIFTSCGSKNDDPVPAKKTDLEVVQASLVGNLAFQSVVVSQISSGKTGKTSTCAKGELFGAGFTDTKWENLTPEPNFVFSGTSAVSIAYPCLVSPEPDPTTYTLTENTDGSFEFILPNNIEFKIKKEDITDTTLKAVLIKNGLSISNSLGYTVTYFFTK